MPQAGCRVAVGLEYGCIGVGSVVWTFGFSTPNRLDPGSGTFKGSALRDLLLFEEMTCTCVFWLRNPI